jgi:rubredoxin
MKHEACGYEYTEYISNGDLPISGEKGDFFQLKDKVERFNKKLGVFEIQRLYACPNCGGAFILGVTSFALPVQN